MKLSDRIDQFKAEVLTTPEGRKKGIKLGVAVGLFAIALVVLAFRLIGPSEPQAKREIPPQIAAEVEKMAQELEQATAEETEAFAQAVAAGEVDPPEPPQEAVRPNGPKGVGYTPGFDPSQPQPEPQPEPEDPEDDPG